MAKKSPLDIVSEEVTMDMTPMIDVVFLLIIFFLCIDFKILEAKLPAYLPKDKGSQTFEVEPVEQLSVVIVCEKWGTEEPRNLNKPIMDPETGKRNAFVLNDHIIHWEVGPKVFREPVKLKEELERIYADKSTWQKDKDDPTKLNPMPVVVEPGESIVYGDVAQTLDAITEAGFTEINFGASQGGR